MDEPQLAQRLREALDEVFTDPDANQAARWTSSFLDLHPDRVERGLASYAASAVAGGDTAPWDWLTTELYDDVDAATDGGLTLRRIDRARFRGIALFALGAHGIRIFTDPRT